MASVKPVTDEEILGEVAVEIGTDVKHSDVTQDKMKIDSSDNTGDTTMDEEDEASSEEKPMVTIKKRGAGDAVAAPAKKKRSPAKTKVEVKSEEDVADDAAMEAIAKGDVKKATTKKAAPKKATPTKATPTKATPKKATPKKATPAKAKGLTVIKNKENVEDENEEDEEVVATDIDQDKVNAAVTPSKARKRTPAKPGSIAVPRGIPTSWEDASRADKMLVTMKDDGKDWPSIRAAWTAQTGQVTAHSSLPNRYIRLKAALERLADGDEPHLIKAKEEIEAKFEREKFGLIADAMEKLGTKRYAAAFIQKQLKDLAAKPAAPKGLENVAAGEPAGAAMGK